MLKVEVGKGRFYVSRHDAKPSSGAEHDGRSAGMVREEGSVHRHSQQLLLSLPACASSPHARRVLSTGALTSHARQQLPATPARGQSAFSSCTTTPLRPADAHAAGKGMPKRGRRLTTQARSTGRRRSWRCLRAPAALSLHAAPRLIQLNEPFRLDLRSRLPAGVKRSVSLPLDQVFVPRSAPLATMTHNSLNDVRFLAVRARATVNWLW